MGYLLWKRSQPAKPAGPNTCDELCKAAQQDNDLCRAACAAGGAILGAVPNPFHNSADQWNNELGHRQQTNDGLNGARAVELPAGLNNWNLSAGGTIANGELLGIPDGTDAPPGLEGGPMKYANGCEPYYGAPGWSKCAPGTLDMWAMAIDAASGAGRGFNESNTNMVANALDPSSFSRGRTVKLNKNNFGTGAVGDPTTQGPQAGIHVVAGQGAVPDGTWQWVVRGQPVTGPAGKVPRAIAMQLVSGGGTDAQVTAAITALTDAQAAELIDPKTAWTHSQTINCSTIPGSNFTWDPSTSSWRRMRAGEQQNLGPCAGQAGPGRASTLLGGSIGGGTVGTAITLSATGWENTTP